MISQLRGRVVSRQPNHAVLDVNGVGYGVSIPLSTFSRLDGAAGEVTLLTHTHVTQDAIELFGFATTVERQLFQLLIKVNGIGPRLAIGILSGITPEDLAAAIERGDEARLVKVPGIGRKIAARLIVELKDGLKKMEIEQLSAAQPQAAISRDLVSALVNLGYPETRAERAVEEAVRQAADEPFEALLRRALGRLGI